MILLYLLVLSSSEITLLSLYIGAVVFIPLVRVFPWAAQTLARLPNLVLPPSPPKTFREFYGWVRWLTWREAAMFGSPVKQKFGQLEYNRRSKV